MLIPRFDWRGDQLSEMYVGKLLTYCYDGGRAISSAKFAVTGTIVGVWQMSRGGQLPAVTVILENCLITGQMDGKEQGRAGETILCSPVSNVPGQLQLTLDARDRVAIAEGAPWEIITSL